MTERPSPTGPDGRDARGRFLPGNRAAKGNPLAQKAQRLRVAFFESVSVADLEEVVGKLVELAKAGDTTAIKILLERCLGAATALDYEERLDVLEKILLNERTRHEFF